MVQFFDEIPERLYGFLNRYHLFFVATAPLEGGSVNVSPKSSKGAFQIVNQNRVRYLDFTGSGNETISHLLQPGNGRITVMFVNIEDGPPNIVRLYGKGTVHERIINSPDSEFADYLPAETAVPPPGTRAIIDIAVHTCVTSCGYSVPIFQYVKERKILSDWATKMSNPINSTDHGIATMKKYKKDIPRDKKLFIGGKVEGRDAQTWLEAYWIWMNSLSIDGLPGLRISRDLAEDEERKRLLQKKLVHDQMAAPKDPVGPFNASSAISTPIDIPSVATAASQASYHLTHLIFAFSLGCILTASIMLAQT